MDIIISDEAVNWFTAEYEIKSKTMIRFFVRYGGFGGNIPAFSLGVNLEEPDAILAATTVGDLTFYVEESDEWYFEGKDLIISLNEELKEPKFEYKN